jgi:hypothetical protein
MRFMMAGKGDGDTRSPDYKARRDGYDKIDWGGPLSKDDFKAMLDDIHSPPMKGAVIVSFHPLGACGSHCDQCVGGCCDGGN